MKDALFAEALTKGDVLIPDGASIVMACGEVSTEGAYSGLGLGRRIPHPISRNLRTRTTGR